MLTPRQVKCLAYIENYIAINGYAPSLDDIATGLGTKSKSSAHRMVEILVARGRLQRLPNKARGIALTEIDPALDVAEIKAEVELIVLREIGAKRGMPASANVTYVLEAVFEAIAAQGYQFTKRNM